MQRLSRVLGTLLLLALLATSALGQIVKVTADQARFYDPETKELKTYEAKGKRFMVYGTEKDWYLVEATISKEKKLVWLSMADAAVDWSEAKTARVAGVVNTSTLKLDDGRFVQFAGIVVTSEDTALTRQTYQWLKGLLEGKQVVLEFDTKTDQSGTAAYVYIGALFVNRALVEYGAATVPDGKGRYEPVLGYYAAQAREATRGLWATEAPEATPTVATQSGAGAQGQDTSGPARQLSQAELVQWKLRLQVEVTVRNELIDDDDETICRRGPVSIGSGSGPSLESSAAIITAA